MAISHGLRVGAYVLIVVATAVSLFALEKRDARNIRGLHDQLCRSFLIIKSNQRFVLDLNLQYQRIFSDRTKAGLTPIPRSFTRATATRLRLLDRQVSCRP